MELEEMEKLVEAVASENLKDLSVLLTTSPHLVTWPTDDEGTTLLHVAAAISSLPAILQQLVQHGADVNAEDQDGTTALHVAALWGNVGTLGQLLDYGADPFVVDSEDMTPLDTAMKHGHTACVELLQTAAGSVPQGGSSDPNMSMVEVFVNMFVDADLTQVSQLSLQDSPTPTRLTANHTPSKEVDLTTTSTSKQNGSRNPRRELFPEIEDEAYLEETIILEFPPITPKPPTASADSAPANTSTLCEQLAGTSLADISKGTTIRDSGQAADFSVLVPVTIPDTILRLSDKELRDKLVALGEQPGPINGGTRSAYQAYLSKIEAGVQPSGNKGYKGYKYELSLVLNGTAPIPNLDSLEQQVFQSFRTPLTSSSSSFNHTPSHPRAPPVLTTPLRTPGRPSSNTPKKQTKDHFNYLLLDPRVLDKMDSACSELERFQIFTESVFYVGKGKNARSLQHLRDAKSCNKLAPAKISSKLKKILAIWSCDRGVVSLQLFHNTTAEEAFSREACLLDAIGMDMLTNVQRGHVYGDMCGWRMNKRRQLGVHLLHRAFKTYLVTTPQQEIFRQDI